MSVTKTFEHLFKPEVRNQGNELIAENAVFISQAGDTQIEGIVKKSQLARVTFRSDSIVDAIFYVDCSCSASERGQLCKHIWAILVKAETAAPDFFSSKRDLEKVEHFAKKADAKSKPATSPEFAAKQLSMKAKQADYRKVQYQKQKARAKELKGSKKASKFAEAPSYSGAVEDALKYFADNGFPMQFPVSEEELGNAKRILARVFHPDKGGSHQEIVDLNHHADVLLSEG